MPWFQFEGVELIENTIFVSYEVLHELVSLGMKM